MGIKGFRYNKYFDVPRKWQEYIYSLSKLYYDVPDIALLMDEVINKVAPQYKKEMLRVLVSGDTPLKVGCDCFVSDRALQTRIRRYYEVMYRKLKELTAKQ